ncbi:LAP1 Leucine aminopeptidase 1 [Candida maltosa Xu316]|uniref:Peptide hydrolase n=1 Tax=Candida maltosa (strain Xu316) TaxID=1245528 RepID=M3HKA3_CANMX|nr:Leucine aminopeptidase, putative [Candida maltosa Xu316]
MKIVILLSLVVGLTNAFPFYLPDWSENAISFLSNSGDHERNRLIKLGPEEYKIVSENDKLKLKRNNVNFIDVTKQIPIEVAVEQGLTLKPSPPSLWRSLQLIGSKQITTLAKEIPVYNYPKGTKYNGQVNAIFEQISVEFLKEKLEKFTSFYTRYYKSSYGLESADWLYGQIEEIIAPVKNKVSIKKIKHDGWDQYSIIVSIPGQVTDKVIVGAHQDSINLLLPNLMRAPGADDDGSGTVTILESLRLLIPLYQTGDFKPYNTLEFHWYSAEEGGLLGSIDVFSQYAAANRVVVGMLQQDMTGYTQGSIDAGIEPHFGLITDYTSVHLNNFLKLIISTYNSIPYHESNCGYSCSDHASALENGYPSSFLIESEMKYTSKYIHSVMDTVDRLDFDHIKEHVKLTIAYAYELSLATDLH